jgi:hypothetical protein
MEGCGVKGEVADWFKNLHQNLPSGNEESTSLTEI